LKSRAESRAVSEVFGNLLIKVKIRNAISSMVFAKEKVEVVSSDAEPCTTLKFPPSGGTLSVSKSCTLYVYVDNQKLNYVPEKPGELLYTLGNRKIALELGGVWESECSRSWMIYPPYVKVSGGRIIVSIPVLSGTGSVGGYGIANVLLRYNSTEVHEYSKANLKLVIRTSFPQAWEKYLKESGFTVNLYGNVVNATASGNVTLVVHRIDVSIY